MKKLLMLGVVMCVVLASCAPAEGFVTAKNFYPAHEATDQDCRRVGKVWSCNTDRVWVPDTWTITLKNGDKEGEVPVSEEEWNRIKIGDYIKVKDLSTSAIIQAYMAEN